MAISIVDNGNRNRIEISNEILSSFNGDITFRGSDNYVSIEGPVLSADRIALDIGSASSVVIGHNCRLGDLNVYTEQGGAMVISPGAAFVGSANFDLREGRCIKIGWDCLFAGGIVFLTSDMHSVIDKKSGKRLNPAKDITLGDRVWLGAFACILKGVTIGNDCIVARHAVVTKSIPDECAVAGNPARVIRTGISWKHALLPVND